MDSSGSRAAALLEKLREFDRVAALLEMPRAERLGILNVSQETYSVLNHGDSSEQTVIQPELERRLSYALPLMRRLASNSPVLRMPDPRHGATA